MPPETVITLPMALVLGLIYGMGPCLVSCLPCLGPLFLAEDSRGKRAWALVLPVSVGRLLVYTGFGALAGSVGHYGASSETLAPGLHLALGCATLLVGMALLLRRRAGRVCGAGRADGAGGAVPVVWQPRMAGGQRVPRSLLPGGLLLMGVAMALTPCAPLGLVLFSAASTGHLAAGALLGLAFGLGAVCVPALVYGLGLARLGNRLRQQLGTLRGPLEHLSVALLLLTGLGQLWRAC